ncbi:MAG: LamG-like jellyroll fold domain-containing protein, partial [Bacteroidota bacterium]
TDPQIVAHFKFDEDKGWSASNSVLTDGSGYGILMGLTPSDTWVEGLVGNAVDFTSGEADSRIEVKDSKILNMDSTDSFTFSMLLHPAPSDEWNTLLIKGEEFHEEYEVVIGNKDLVFRVDDGTNKTEIHKSYASYIEEDTWFHLVCIRDRAADVLKAYCNVNLIDEVEDVTEGSINTDGQPLLIGNRNELDRPYRGKMDELQLYNYAMSVDEIIELTESYGFVVSVDNKMEQIPVTYSLDQNYPNPFNPSTTIQFGLPKASDVKVTVYNAIGQVVEELVNGHLNAGYHKLNFNASNISSGIYFYRITAGDFVNVKKMILLK